MGSSEVNSAVRKQQREGGRCRWVGCKSKMGRVREEVKISDREWQRL